MEPPLLLTLSKWASFWCYLTALLILSWTSLDLTYSSLFWWISSNFLYFFSMLVSIWPTMRDYFFLVSCSLWCWIEILALNQISCSSLRAFFSAESALSTFLSCSRCFYIFSWTSLSWCSFSLSLILSTDCFWLLNSCCFCLMADPNSFCRRKLSNWAWACISSLLCSRFIASRYFACS